MAVITINKKQFEKDIGPLNSQMQEKIALFGTPIDRLDDKEFQIEIYPNRPDLLSYHGFKRSFLGFLGKKTGLKEYKLNKSPENYVVKIDPSVKNIRPFTACAIVKGIKPDDERIKEIIEFQEKLHATIGRKRKKLAIGIYPLEKIKLPITFKALEPDKIIFIPLGAEREMSGLQILQRHPVGREYASLLAGKAKFPIFIDSAKNILSMPPIINSHLTGKITSDTEDVFIECSGFDFPTLSKCLNIIVTILADMGGKIYPIELQENHGAKRITPDLSSSKMKLNLENANKLLGINLTEKEIKSLLEKMGYDYNKGNVEIPCFRLDILHEVDLIEDVAIAYGYENFSPEIPKISTTGKEDQKETFKRKIAEILAGLGMLELSNYHLTTKKDQFESMGPKNKENPIELIESKTDYSILRRNLSHYLLKNLSENIDSEYPQKIFETGRVFDLKGAEIKETESLSASIIPGNFTEIKQVLEYFSRMIDIKIEFKVPEPSRFPGHFIDGRVAEVMLKDKSIGFIGEIHPKILKNWRLKMPAALFEINLDEVFGELEK
jgi:phenylalanyl-tRNA synthetase beta chain